MIRSITTRSKPTSSKRGGDFFYGWWVAIAAAVVVGYTSGVLIWGPSAFFKPIAEEFQWKEGTTSAALTVPRLITLGLIPLVGFLLDRYGSRRVLTVGALIMGSGLILTSFAVNFWSYVLTYAIASSGTALVLQAPGSAAIINWFVKKRTSALAVMWAGSTGGALMPRILVWLIDQTSWQTALVVAGLGTWIVLLPMAMIMRPRPEPYGYLPDGEKPPEGLTPVQLRIQSELETSYTVSKALRTKAFWGLSIVWAFMLMNPSVLQLHHINYLTSDYIGFTKETAAFLIFVVGIFALPSRFIWGWFGDNFDKRLMVALLGILFGLSFFLLSQIDTLWQAWLFSSIYGLVFGGIMIASTALIGDLFGRKHFASITGVCQVMGNVVTFPTPILVGLAAEGWDEGYRTAFLLIAATNLIIPIATLWIRRPKSIPQRSEAPTSTEAAPSS